MQRMQRQSPVFIREVTVSTRQEQWWWQRVLLAKLEESTRSDGDRVTDHRGQERFPGTGDLTAHSWRASRKDIGRKGREWKMATGKRNDITIQLPTLGCGQPAPASLQIQPSLIPWQPKCLFLLGSPPFLNPWNSYASPPMPCHQLEGVTVHINNPASNINKFCPTPQ